MLQDVDSDAMVELTWYTIIKSDGTATSQQQRGVGVCACVTDEWYKNINVIEKFCDPNIELLA